MQLLNYTVVCESVTVKRLQAYLALRRILILILTLIQSEYMSVFGYVLSAPPLQLGLRGINYYVPFKGRMVYAKGNSAELRNG